MVSFISTLSRGLDAFEGRSGSAPRLHALRSSRHQVPKLLRLHGIRLHLCLGISTLNAEYILDVPGIGKLTRKGEACLAVLFGEANCPLMNRFQARRRLVGR